MNGRGETSVRVYSSGLRRGQGRKGGHHGQPPPTLLPNLRLPRQNPPFPLSCASALPVLPPFSSPGPSQVSRSVCHPGPGSGHGISTFSSSNFQFSPGSDSDTDSEYPGIGSSLQYRVSSIDRLYYNNLHRLDSHSRLRLRLL